ncbi:MAG: RDD family protein [Defluviitaleaceae bacterium]|nr:RDD family protein [Defluviitaleaceae bacterium]MCL2239788.1 RDD family protein [Defluviitaleaceae bacterium]
MKTIAIVTPANIEVEYRLAGVGSRLAAFIIDYTLQLVAIALLAGVILLGFDRWVFNNTSPSGVALGAVMVGAFVINFGYFILCELNMNGQSVGKKIFGLRAIRENGQPLQLSHVLVRALFRTSVDILYVGLFVILFSKRHKRLGDMAAGTVVVGEYYSKMEDVGFSAPPHDIPEFITRHTDTLSPEESRVVDEWLRRRHTLPDGGAEIERGLAQYYTAKEAIHGKGTHAV